MVDTAERISANSLQKDVSNPEPPAVSNQAPVQSIAQQELHPVVIQPEQTANLIAKAIMHQHQKAQGFSDDQIIEQDLSE